MISDSLITEVETSILYYLSFLWLSNVEKALKSTFYIFLKIINERICNTYKHIHKIKLLS